VRETTLQAPRSVKKEGEEVLKMSSLAARDEDHGDKLITKSDKNYKKVEEMH